MAMRMGKHAFIQKPLTWSVEEARVLRTLAAEKKLAPRWATRAPPPTASAEGVEVIRSGILGAVKEIHVWTNRPIWPQGIARPKDTPAGPQRRPLVRVPRLGPRPALQQGLSPLRLAGLARLRHRRPRRHGLPHHQRRRHGPGPVRPRDRRGRRHLGHRRPRDLPDLVDHQDPLRRARRPGPARPDLVRRRRQPPQGEAGPRSRRCSTARRCPAAACSWSARRARSSPPTTTAPSTPCCPGTSSRTSPRSRQTLPHSPGHFKEWVEAIKANDPSKALSNFDYAGRLTETVLLGVVALKVGGKIEWDAAGHEGQEQLRRRPVPPARLPQGLLDPRLIGSTSCGSRSEPPHPVGLAGPAAASVTRLTTSVA